MFGARIPFGSFGKPRKGERRRSAKDVTAAHGEPSGSGASNPISSVVSGDSGSAASIVLVVFVLFTVLLTSVVLFRLRRGRAQSRT